MGWLANAVLVVVVVDEGLHDVVSVVLELIRRKNFAIGLGFDLVVVVIRCWLLRLHEDGCGNILYDNSGTSSAVLFGGALIYGRVSSVC